MGELISLVDRLRQRNTQITYEHGKFPLFEGKVLSVSGEIISGAETVSIIDYLPTGTNLPEPNFAMAITDQGREEYERLSKEAIQRVLVPFSVNPEVVSEANVKGYLEKMDGNPAYVLEVLRDQSISEGAKLFGALAGHRLGSKYEGFRYIVLLK